MSNITKIAIQLQIDDKKAAAAVKLLQDGNTVPFIARYRKEITGGLDEEQIREIRSLHERLITLDKRRKTILKTIREQGKLTEKIKNQIITAGTNIELEDIYQPYKPKRKTRAGTAREQGLQPLADLILEQPDKTEKNIPLDDQALPFLNEQFPTPLAAWGGARDIAAETISDHSQVRQTTREKAGKWGKIYSKKIKKSEDLRGVYQSYYDFENHVERLLPHQVLAINRGEKDKVLRVRVHVPERDWRNAVATIFPANHISPFNEQLNLSAEDAADRLLLPAIIRDLRKTLTEKAETHAIQVFATNLGSLLNQPPLKEHVVMGIDPGFRTGCKVAVVDPTGKPCNIATIYPHPPQKQVIESKQILTSLIKQYDVTIIAVGNGTAARETEIHIAEVIKGFSQIDVGPGEPINHKSTSLHYLIVSEAGASVYSASKLARQELPDMGVSIRGAVSIARRVQDPLAELVKIDPKSIGVGMYQHDIDQKKLGNALDAVVESVVNFTGVDINSASPALLSHISGIGSSLANKIVKFRDQNGPFKSREELLKVPGMGPKAYVQSAGFLRIRSGNNPLDNTAIHPESYPTAKKLLQRAGIEFSAGLDKRTSLLNALRNRVSMEDLASEINTGVPTLEDIFEQLTRPGRDPREDMPPPILRSDVLKMEDLIPGMQLIGTIRNVVDFGAFVDIGVKSDGLLHRSKIPHGTKLAVGNVIPVEIRNVEIDRGRISLGLPDTSRE